MMRRWAENVAVQWRLKVKRATTIFLAISSLSFSIANATDALVTISLESPPLPPVVGAFYSYHEGQSGCNQVSEALWQQCFLENFAQQHIACPSINMAPTSGWQSRGPYYETMGIASEEMRDYSYTYFAQSQSGGACNVPHSASVRVFNVRSVGCSGLAGYTPGETMCENDKTDAITVVPPVATASVDGNPCVGNPCNVATGDKVESELDYDSPILPFARTYHSFLPRGDASMGNGWTHSYSSRLLLQASEQPESSVIPAALATASGYVDPLVEAVAESGIYISRAGSGNRVIAGTGLQAGHWILHASTGDKEVYGNTGLLLQKISRSGEVTSLAYVNGLLASVTGPHGHSLAFRYNDRRLIDRVTDSGGRYIYYEYDNQYRVLTRVTYQDGSYREYLYGDANSPLLLTGIVDENSDEYATFAYDSKGRVVSSGHAGGVGQVTLAYDDATNTTTVTDAAGTQTIYAFTPLEVESRQWDWRVGSSPSTSHSSFAAALAAARARGGPSFYWWNLQPVGVSHMSAPTGAGQYPRKVVSAEIGGDGAQYAYSSDFARRIDSVTDANGNRTKYGYSSGSGTDFYHTRAITEADQDTTGQYRRTTSTLYKEDISDLPLYVTSPSVAGGTYQKTVTTDYVDGSRLVESIKIDGFDLAGNFIERETTIGDYDQDGQSDTADDFQPGYIDGPRTDVSDLTRFTTGARVRRELPA